MKPLAQWSTTDFEQFGFGVARETQCLEKALELGGLKIHEYRAGLQPDIDRLRSGIAAKTEQKAALCAQIYDPNDPVNDKAMLARTIVLRVLVCVLGGIALTSAAAHVYRLLLFGLEVTIAIVVGIVLTIAVAGIGHLAFEKLVRHGTTLQNLAIGVSACLVIWGTFELAQAGAAAMAKANANTRSAQSYVDGEDGAPTAEADTSSQTSENHIDQLLSNAITKILLGADLSLGILFGIVTQMRSDENFVAWKKIAQLETELERMNWQLNRLAASIEVAQRQCMAGILRFFYGQRKPHPPYFKAGAACVLLVILATTSARAQWETHQEAILIDVSGSIGAGGGNKELFKEYLMGARQLLLSEPPNSRVVVLLISTDSFGGGRELLKGRTPPARGVFTDDLNRARRQLVAAFEKKTSRVSPIAAGTDILGGLWRAKTLLESGSPSSDEREIWIFSDMMNETPALPMPALIATGPDKMLEHVIQNGLLVPLKGYRIHVLGASTRDLSPQAWNVIKTFWAQYFRAADTESATYSEDSSPER